MQQRQEILHSLTPSIMENLGGLPPEPHDRKPSTTSQTASVRFRANRPRKWWHVRCRESALPLEDRFELGPIEKWTKYRVVPLQLLIHIALVILLTHIAIEFNTTTGSFSSTLGLNFRRLFYPPGFARYSGRPSACPLVFPLFSLTINPLSLLPVSRCFRRSHQ